MMSWRNGRKPSAALKGILKALANGPMKDPARTAHTARTGQAAHTTHTAHTARTGHTVRTGHTARTGYTAQRAMLRPLALSAALLLILGLFAPLANLGLDSPSPNQNPNNSLFPFTAYGTSGQAAESGGEDVFDGQAADNGNQPADPGSARGQEAFGGKVAAGDEDTLSPGENAPAGEEDEEAAEEDGEAADGDGEAEEDEEDYAPSYDMAYYSKFKDAGITLSVYNWGEYISDGSDGLMDIDEEFTKLTGIKINQTNFATNEEMYAKIKSGGTNYDIIVPSDYMIARMIVEDMLDPIDYSNIPNAKYLDPQFDDNSYDPGNAYSVPYAWNTIAIIYNKTMVTEKIDSWKILWDEKYAGQILMVDNSRDAFGLTLKMLGYSLNTEDPAKLKEAAQMLMKQKPLVQAYVMDQAHNKMLGNEAALVPYYSGEATLMQMDNPDIDAAFPKEGTNLFMDSISIPKGARHKEAAEMYINFLNEPNVAAENIEYIGYSTPNLGAYELLDDEIKNNKIIYPDPEVLANAEQFVYLSEETNLLMDQLWTQVLSTKGSFWSWGFPPILVVLGICIGKWAYKRHKKQQYKKMLD